MKLTKKPAYAASRAAAYAASRAAAYAASRAAAYAADAHAKAAQIKMIAEIGNPFVQERA